MEVSQSRFSGQGRALATSPVIDPRLQPTPDYGTLGPGSDIAVNQAGSTPDPVRRPTNQKRFGAIFASAIGMLAAILSANIGSARGSWSRFQNSFSTPENAPTSANESKDGRRAMMFVPVGFTL